MKRRFLCMSAQLVMIDYTLAACATSGAYPPAKDLAAVTELKPKPLAAILTDPAADARYNSAVEAWGDRLYAAGARLCRFAERTGMKGLDCPGK